MQWKLVCQVCALFTSVVLGTHFSVLIIQVLSSESKKSPFILFIREVEKSILGNFERYAAVKKKLEKLEGSVVVIGSHSVSDSRKEKVISYYLSPNAFLSESSVVGGRPFKLHLYPTDLWGLFLAGAGSELVLL